MKYDAKTYFIKLVNLDYLEIVNNVYEVGDLNCRVIKEEKTT